MAKSVNQKLKLLYLIEMLQEKTDEEHFLSMQEILEGLALKGISAERKSIYDDMEQLTQFGYDIIYVKSRTNGGYYLASREFELAELKLLVDAVQASKFITAKKSRELIGKIETLTSKTEAKKLQRQVLVAGRIKTENESIYYSIDAIHRAIQNDVQIQFSYLEWNMKKELQPKGDGKLYQVSPLILLWQEENYYLVAYEDATEMIKHYRVDKMGNLNLTERKRAGRELLETMDMASYTKQTFGMFGGKESMVTLEFSNRLIGVVIDRFGKDVSIRPIDSERFRIRVSVIISSQFFGWLTGMGSGVVLTGPDETVKLYLEYLNEIQKQYDIKF